MLERVLEVLAAGLALPAGAVPHLPELAGERLPAAMCDQLAERGDELVYDR